MARVKRKEENNKVSKREIKIKCEFMSAHDTVLFSFKYITNQNDFNLKRFKRSKNIRDDMNVLSDFHEFLSKMSKDGWEAIRDKDKNQSGRELLDYSQIRFNAYDPRNELKLAKDSKIWVLRFGGNKYRLIGYRSNKCKAIFHILGIDHNFSAYNHG